MNFTNLIKVAFKAIANNKFRSFLSMLGIIIGVAAVIIMMAIGQGSKQSVRADLSKMGTNLLPCGREPTCAAVSVRTLLPCRHSRWPTTKAY